MGPVERSFEMRKLVGALVLTAILLGVGIMLVPDRACAQQILPLNMLIHRATNGQPWGSVRLDVHVQHVSPPEAGPIVTQYTNGSGECTFSNFGDSVGEGDLLILTVVGGPVGCIPYDIPFEQHQEDGRDDITWLYQGHPPIDPEGGCGVNAEDIGGVRWWIACPNFVLGPIPD
jgi:hypothetical protein